MTLFYVIYILVPSISNIFSVCLLNPKTCHQNKFKKQNSRRHRNERNSPVWAKKQIPYDPSTITIDSLGLMAKEACYSSVIQSIVLGWNFSRVLSNSRRICNLYFPSSTTATMTVSRTSQVLEEGDIFFFYRPRVGKEEVDDIEDIQRLYMITAPEDDGRYRLFILGQKRLPEIVEGKSTSEERNWALNILTTDNPEDIRKEFLPAEYETETRGRRRLAAAIPAGEGKYAIVKHDNHTELAYVLELPKVPGPVQKEFGIKKEASYIISVKNPNIEIPGFAVFEKRKPKYPAKIKEAFEDRRWINVENPDILNYENTQVLLIGAKQGNVEKELGIELNEEKETENTAELFKELKIRKEQVPLKPFLRGEFPSKRDAKQRVAAAATEVRTLSREEAPGRGGKVVGQAAATRAPSAAALAKLLSGVDFPKTRSELLTYAKRNRQKVKAAEEIIQIIRELPERRYKSMADVEKALAKIR